MSEENQNFNEGWKFSQSSVSRPRSYGEGSSRQAFESIGVSTRAPVLSSENGSIDSQGIQQKYVGQSCNVAFHFKIRFTTGTDVALKVSNDSMTVLDFKKEISSLLPERHPPDQLRLIYQGRILLDNHNIRDVFSKLIDQKLSKLQKYGLTSTKPTLNSEVTLGSIDSPIILHGQILAEPSTNSSDAQLQQIVPQVGFDRLQEAGFSDDDIRSLRAQFQALHNIDPNTTDPEVLEQTRQLEEAWIDDATTILPDGSSGGADYEYLLGITIGYFVGVIALFWIKEHTFSKKHQIGLFLGIAINFFFGLITVLS